MIRKIWYVKDFHNKQYKPVYIKPVLSNDFDRFNFEVDPYFFTFMFILIDTLLLLPYIC
jgi:hypothetical protein